MSKKIKTTKKYKANGIPLTPYERELLTHLVEECSEVIHAACKLLRYGKENRPSDNVNNSVILSMEIGNIEAVIEDVIIRTEILHVPSYFKGIKDKRKNMEFYMINDPPKEIK